jgi:hypothetical protein
MKSFKRIRKSYQNLTTKLPSPPKNIEPAALNLIELRRDKLILNEEALQVLKDIEEDLIIVFIFGKGGSGKSFLMNLLINSNDQKKKFITNSIVSTKNLKGFKVNSYFNSLKGNKKGIYFWSSPIEKENSKEKILFFDSEGVNSENVDQQTLESKLLALMIIISSLFIYNTKGDINSYSLNDLQLIVQLTDSINIEGKIDKDEMIAELCPKFIWTLRDFNLEKYKQIKKRSDMYLEECLNDDRFKGKNKDEINMISESLVRYFKKRECVIMPCPTNEEKEVVMLKRMELSELNENFQNEFEVLKKKIYESSKAKSINGKKITGPILVSLLKSFIREINKEKIPNLDKIFLELIKKELDINYNSAKNEFKKRMDNLKKEEDIDIKEMYHIKYEIINEFIKILEKNPEIFNKENYLKEYETTKERLDQGLDKIIKADLDILIPDYSYDKILKEKNIQNYTNVNELIQDYLNILIEFKMDMTDTILNKKDFEMFIKNDLIKTNEIIDYIKKNENEIIINDYNEEDEINNEGDNDINNIKTELENAEKEKLEIIKNYSLLLEKRDKILRNSLKYMSYGKHSIRSYSSKLVTINLGEEKSCELSKEEKEEERCNCNLNSFKNCIVF